MSGYTITSQLTALITQCNKRLEINDDELIKLEFIQSMQDKLTVLSLIIENQLIHLNKLESDIQAKQKRGKS